MKEDNYIRVRFGPRETGWAERRDGGVFLNNIPLEEDLCLDDEVELGPDEGGFPTIARVVARRWPRKSAIEYQPATQAAWARICEVIRTASLGWTEGWALGIGGCVHTPALTDEKLGTLLADTGIRASLQETHEPPLRGRREAATGGA